MTITIWRKLLLVYLVLLGLILAYAATIPKNPGASIQAVLGPVTDQEYSELHVQQLNQSDLQKLHVQLKMTDAKSLLERSIVLPDLAAPLDRLDHPRVVHSARFEQNRLHIDDEAVVEQTVIFDARGLDDDRIRSLYENESAYLAYRTASGEGSSDRFSIASVVHRTSK